MKWAITAHEVPLRTHGRHETRAARSDGRGEQPRGLPLSPGRPEGRGSMLRGSALAKVDDKGRLKVPASFRAALESKFGPEFFVTSLRGESVRIYPIESWVRIEERMARVSSMNPAVMRFKNAVNYFGQT